jgi:hypothetical protein
MKGEPAGLRTRVPPHGPFPRLPAQWRSVRSSPIPLRVSPGIAPGSLANSPAGHRLGVDGTPRPGGGVRRLSRGFGFYAPGSWTREQLVAFANELDPLVPERREIAVDLVIVRGVKALRDREVETFESCDCGDGHRPGAGPGRGRTGGWCGSTRHRVRAMTRCSRT